MADDTSARIPTLEDLEAQLGDLSGKRILVRTDFNVPLDGARVADDPELALVVDWLGGSFASAAQAGLESFLFGQAASLLKEDVVVMGVLGGACLVLLGLLWKEFKLLSFDPDFAASLGLPVRRLDGLLTLLLVVAINVAAVLSIPLALSRHWSGRAFVASCLTVCALVLLLGLALLWLLW